MSTPASRIGTGLLRRQKVFFVADGRRAINDGAHARGGLCVIIMIAPASISSADALRLLSTPAAASGTKLRLHNNSNPQQQPLVLPSSLSRPPLVLLPPPPSTSSFPQALAASAASQPPMLLHATQKHALLLRALAYAVLGALGQAAGLPLLAPAVLLWIDPQPAQGLCADIVLFGGIASACDDQLALLALCGAWVLAGALTFVLPVPSDLRVPAGVVALCALARASLRTPPSLFLAHTPPPLLLQQAPLMGLGPSVAYIALACVDTGLPPRAPPCPARLRYGGVLCCSATSPLALVVAVLVLVLAQSASYYMFFHFYGGGAEGGGGGDGGRGRGGEGGDAQGDKYEQPHQHQPAGMAVGVVVEVDALDVHEALRLAQAQHYNNNSAVVSAVEKNV